MMRLCPFCQHRAFIDTQCPICGAHIEEIRDAEEALDEMHRKYIDVICPQCGKTVSSGQLILIGPDLQCNYCGKVMDPWEWLQYRKKEVRE